MPICIQCRESYVKAAVPPNGRRLLSGFCGIGCQIFLEQKNPGAVAFQKVWLELSSTVPGAVRPDISDVLAVDPEYQALDGETRKLGRAYFASVEARKAYQRRVKTKLGV